MEYNNDPNVLVHYGILGMKWGVRRYQNSDGTLTPAGKKRYNDMSDDDLSESIHKQIKGARTKQYGLAERWSDRPIGKNSKAAHDVYDKAHNKRQNSAKMKEFEKKKEELEVRYLQDKIDDDAYNKEMSKLKKSIYRPELDSSSLSYGNKTVYSKPFLDKYGKNINTAYLKDLGFDDKTAKEFSERVMKARRKLVW